MYVSETKKGASSRQPAAETTDDANRASTRSIEATRPDGRDEEQRAYARDLVEQFVDQMVDPGR